MVVTCQFKLRSYSLRFISPHSNYSTKFSSFDLNLEILIVSVTSYEFIRSDAEDEQTGVVSYLRAWEVGSTYIYFYGYMHGDVWFQSSLFTGPKRPSEIGSKIRISEQVHQLNSVSFFQTHSTVRRSTGIVINNYKYKIQFALLQIQIHLGLDFCLHRFAWSTSSSRNWESFFVTDLPTNKANWCKLTVSVSRSLVTKNSYPTSSNTIPLYCETVLHSKQSVFECVNSISFFSH